MGLTGFVIIHVFIASFSPAQGERNQMVNTKFTRPVNEMPMSTFKFYIQYIIHRTHMVSPQEVMFLLLIVEMPRVIFHPKINATRLTFVMIVGFRLDSRSRSGA